MKKILAILLFVLSLFCGDATAKTLSYVPGNPTRALIIIHGYGQNGHSLRWMTDNLKKSMPDMAFYYPTAPDRAPVGGYQWFVIPNIGEQIKEKALYDVMMEGAMKNVQTLHDLVDEIHEKLNLPYENIYVAGFSQGGLMALLTALTNPHKIPAAVSFSGVPLLFTPDFTQNSVKNYPDILVIQGTKDVVIPKDSLQMTTETLTEIGIEPTVRVIEGMAHQIDREALKAAIEFIK